MLGTQKQVNDVVAKRAKWQPDAMDYLTAFEVEFWEYVNSIGLFKWWKLSNTFDKAKILDELADGFAFFLSAVLTQPLEIKQEDKTLHPQQDTIDIVIKNYENIKQAIGVVETEADRNREALGLIKEIALVGEAGQGKQIRTVAKFGAAIYLITLVFPDITWDEVVAAYNEKSRINIERQQKNY
jgi:dimeric dUTPase (all-alpha-NTP-PPase superfamily)